MVSICGGNRLCLYDYAFLSILAIIIYGRVIRKTTRYDLFVNKFIDIDGCDIWGLSHMLLYVILGYKYPNKHLLFLILGILWELAETILGVCNINMFGKRIYLVGSDDNGNLKTLSDKDYWYGRITDILFNLIGYIIGSYIRTSRELINITYLLSNFKNLFTMGALLFFIIILVNTV